MRLETSSLTTKLRVTRFRQQNMEVRHIFLALLFICFRAEPAEPVKAAQDGATVRQMFDLTSESKCIARGANGQCSEVVKQPSKTEGTPFGPRFQKVHLELPRINPVRVGYTRRISITDAGSHEMKTLAVHPPVYEIQDFLSSDECAAMIYLAKEKGMKKPLPVAKNIDIPVENDHSLFDSWDEDLDGSLSFTEISRIKQTQHLLLDKEDILKMYAELGIEADEKGHLSYGELARVTFSKFRDYLQGLSERKAAEVVNQTEQTRMWHDEDGLLAFDDVFQNYHQRLSNLTRIPKELIEESEPLQVTLLKNGSFTECRHDSDPFIPEIPCCVFGSTSHCRACRFISVMYFLNDVEDGELLFPLANNKTFLWDNLHADTTRMCSKAPNTTLSNLVIKPKKGTAIMWYNHYIGRATGWMSTLDPMSFYSSNHVRSGEKWVATTWVNILGDGVNELRPWRLGTNWLSPNNRKKELIELMRNDDFVEGLTYSHDAKLIVVDESEAIYEKPKGANENVVGNLKSDNSSVQVTNTTTGEAAEGNVTESEKNVTRSEEMEGKAQKQETTEVKAESREVPKKQKSTKKERVVTETPISRKETAKEEGRQGIKKVNRNRSPEKGEGPLGPPLRGHPTKENEAPVGPRVEDTLPYVLPSGKMVENKVVVSILMLIDELSRDELEIIARSLHERLQLACIPIMVNPIGPM